LNNETPDILSPEECKDRIFEISGTDFEPGIAADLWSKIMNHKWFLSEKLAAMWGCRPPASTS
jgi:hypothetical protein